MDQAMKCSRNLSWPVTGKHVTVNLCTMRVLKYAMEWMTTVMETSMRIWPLRNMRILTKMDMVIPR